MHAFMVSTLRKLREEWGTQCVIGASEIKAWATPAGEATRT